MDDFLWNCAMEASSDNRLDIIPDFEDDMRQFGLQSEGQTQPERVFTLEPDSASGDISVQIVESRDYGVLDIIGGELWEGALLLCAYILMHKDDFLDHNVLELGSGVGLPGLLLAALKARHSSRPSSVILSDNDPRVVRNLNTAVTSQFHISEDSSKSESEGPKLITKQLDWSIFTPQDTSNSPSPPTATLGDAALQVLEETRNQSTVIMGCELCYAPYHARCLAELLRSYLLRGYCEKVLIVQMRDREGFAELQRNLRSYDILYVIEEIPAELHELAQGITCHTGHAANNNSAQCTKNSSCTSSGGGGSRRTFEFTSEILRGVDGNCYDNDGTHTAGISSRSSLPGGDCALADKSPRSNALLHTAKENFVILTINAHIFSP